MTTDTAITDLLTTFGADPADAGRIEVSGADPIVPSVHRLADATAAAVGVFAQQVAALGAIRGYAPQQVRVDAQAVIDQLMATSFSTLAGHPVTELLEDPALLRNSDFYRTRDGRWIFVLTTYPHLRDAVHAALGTAQDPVAIARAVAGWDAVTLEDAIVRSGGVAAVARTPTEWAAHPAGRYAARRPVVEIERIADADPVPLRAIGESDEALRGVRVLDNTHVIAGPVSARLLAQFGADVLHLSRPDRPDPNTMIAMTGGGKRNAFCDLRRPSDRAAFDAALQHTDVFVNAYRGAARHGVAADQLVAQRPGLIALEYHAWGADGPWGERGGFDQLACAATGFAHEEWTDRPSLPPTYLLNDYLAAYLGAAAVAAALRRRATEGGSWRIRVTLAGVCMWVQRLGLFDRNAVIDLPRPGAHPFGELTRTATAFGELVEPALPFRYSDHAPPRPGYRAPLGSSALAWW